MLKGFPFNQKQSLLLDKYLGGINLALLVRGNQSSEFENKIQDVLNYYRKRVTHYLYRVHCYRLNLRPTPQKRPSSRCIVKYSAISNYLSDPYDKSI